MPSLHDAYDAYDTGDDVDLGGYAGSLATYAAGVGAMLLLAHTSGRELPGRYSAQDLVVGGVATHKLTRLLSRASVTSPLRAPFTTFDEAAGSGEHLESPRGEHGLRHTVGALLTCPFCLGVWVGTAYVAGLVAAPRPTRSLAAVMTVVAGSDALQHAYSRLRGD